MARILVVEDNPANMKLTSLLLHSAGHSVLSAVDAETALRLARGEQPDLILMDIQLPGISGFDALKTLRSDPLTRSIPVIAVTASVMSTQQNDVLMAGFDALDTLDALLVAAALAPRRRGPSWAA